MVVEGQELLAKALVVQGQQYTGYPVPHVVCTHV